MQPNIALNLLPLSGLLEKIIDEVAAGDRRKHEQKMKELSIIDNSNLRDEYVRQMLLDRFIAPIEKAQHDIQKTAMHAQYLAEMVNYYYYDHGLSKEQSKELATHLKTLAIKITQAESLYDLKFVYAVTTLFSDKISVFKHKERKYSLEREIRKGILNPLSTCIATERNFKRRIDLYVSDSIENTNGLKTD